MITATKNKLKATRQATLVIKNKSKASTAFLEFCKTLSFVKIKNEGTSKLNPSPSNDPWWDIPENRKYVEEGLEDVKAGRLVKITRDELRKAMGL